MTLSIIIQMYHPIWEKIQLTIDSILLQESIDYELIFSDDGSDTDYFSEINEYLKSQGFDGPVKYAKCEQNVGTVKSIHNALMNYAVGEYTKLISPGDLIHGRRALVDWVEDTRKNNAAVSLGELIYYNMDEAGHIAPEQHWVSPQYNQYKDQQDFLKHYVFYNDMCIGFCAIFRTAELKKYLDRFPDKVIYAEDNVIRVMIWAGEKACHFDHPIGLYEAGTGISTNDVWKQRLVNDWNAATKIMFEANPDQSMIKKFEKANSCNFIDSKAKKALSYLTMPGKFIWYVRDAIHPRMSRMDVDDEFIGFLGNGKTNEL